MTVCATIFKQNAELTHWYCLAYVESMSQSARQHINELDMSKWGLEGVGRGGVRGDRGGGEGGYVKRLQ